MKILRFLFLSLVLVLPLFAQDAVQDTQDTIEANLKSAQASAWVIPIEGDIMPSMVTFVRREARRALDGGADYLIFEIDTFGGRVDSALQITSFIMSIKNAKTVAWIRNSETSMGVSWSAGALIAMACNQIYMANGTSIGAAAPVTLGADGSTEGTGEKTVSAIRSQIAATAEKNDHPTGIALAMVDYDIELWEVIIEGETKALSLSELERLEVLKPGMEGYTRDLQRVGIISPQGKLLSLTAREAYRYGLSSGLADDREQLLTLLGAPDITEESAPSAWDSIISFLLSGPVQGVLILIGLVMIFLEIQSPGFGIPGTVAAVCFVLVFGSSFMLGMVGSLEIILFILGIGLLVVEIFLLPGFGIAGISGLLLIGISLILSMQDFVLPQFEWEWNFLGRNVMVVGLALLAGITGIALIVLFGQKIKLFDALTLKTQINQSASEGGGWQDDGGIESDYTALVGKTGKALTTLRPIGKADIDGQVYQVETDGSYLDSGVDIKVVKVKGNIIMVRSI